MRNVLLLTLVIICIFFFLEKTTSNHIVLSPSSITKQQKNSNSISKARNEGIITRSIFVPYWTQSDSLEVNDYDQVIYFGITPSESGINTTDNGYANISSFIKSIPPGKKTLLTLRMIDSEAAFSIIEDQHKSQTLITETINTAKNYGFDGIVLDLEVKSLPFDSVLQNISNFQKKFYTDAKKNDLLFDFAIYGDTFFRIRPYNVKDVGTYADTVMIMAYDFSKAGGADPGPNFPYAGKEKYGYDFQQMTNDFLQVVPAEKLAVIFGMYGYDWEVDGKGKAVSPGESMSLSKINAFLSVCRSCKSYRDTIASETKVTYQDASGKPHIIWYEDTDSVSKKESFAKEKGIKNFSYWAYSYF